MFSSKEKRRFVLRGVASGTVQFSSRRLISASLDTATLLLLSPAREQGSSNSSVLGISPARFAPTHVQQEVRSSSNLRFRLSFDYFLPLNYALTCNIPRTVAVLTKSMLL